MKQVPSTGEGLRSAAEAIRAGEVVAYPTETMYGLGVDPFAEAAVRRLFDVKGRSLDRPLLLIVADLDQLGRVAAEVSPAALAYAEEYWPGPLSMLFPKSAALPDLVTGGRGKVCVRCPASAVARDLCRAFGNAITSTSANRSGAPPARSAHQVDLPDVALVIGGATLPVNPPSTVFDPETGDVLREGMISDAELAAFARRRGIRPR